MVQDVTTVFWDKDIAELELSDPEKNGLQVFRNYTRAFKEHERERFTAQFNAGQYDLSGLRSVLESIASDDARLIPVLACAFFDACLDEMYKREIPKGVPGGRETLFTGYGPLSSLSKRIQIAYAFGWMSPDLLADMDCVRKVRNKLSHAWDHAELADYFAKPPISSMSAVEAHVAEQKDRLLFEGVENLDALGRFRVRLLWVIGRAQYESLAFPAALKQRIDPHVLYGEKCPKLLQDVAGMCAEFTRSVMKKNI